MRSLAIALCLLYFVALEVGAQAFHHDIGVQPERPAPGAPFSLTLSGRWPNGCLFETPRVSLNEQTIEIVLVPRDAICPTVVLPYTVTINPFGGDALPRAGVYLVRVLAEQLPGGPRRLIAFRLVDVSAPGARHPSPEPGIWAAERGGRHDTSGTGVGFELDRQGGLLFLAANMYDGQGRPTWYMSAGSIQGAVMRGDYYLSAGGQALYDGYRAPTQVAAVGRLDVEFTSGSTATLWFSRPGAGLLDPIDLMPISIHRFNFAYGAIPESLQGRWILVAEDERSAIPTRHVELSPVRFGAFTLLGFQDLSKRVLVQCVMDPARPESLPGQCVLFVDDREVGRFDQVSYTRLRGQDDRGFPITLLRVNP